MEPNRTPEAGDYAVDLDEDNEVGSLHDLPPNDTHTHVLSADCWCKPVVDSEAEELVYVHFAHDGRDRDYH